MPSASSASDRSAAPLPGTEREERGPVLDIDPPQAVLRTIGRSHDH